MRVWLILGVVVLLVVGALRVRSIVDDRTWVDEDSVIFDGYAIPWLAHGPKVFHHEDLRVEPTLSSVVTGLKDNDAYPPAVPLTVFAMRGWTNPILAVRSLYFALGLSLLILVFWMVWRVSGRLAALVALAYVGFDPQMMAASQQIKWSALVPFLATAATALLMSLRERQSSTKWAAYVVTVLLLVHTHYFCVWIVPAHLAFAWRAPSPFSRALLLRLGAVVALSIPWLLWGFPSQRRWLEGYYRVFLVDRPSDTWYQPFTLNNLVAGYGYTMAATGGLQPSPLRTRYLIPLLPVLFSGLVFAARSANVTVRRWTFLALAPYALGLAGQTAYSWQDGNTIRLGSIYLIAWSPLVLVSLVYGFFEIRRVVLRSALQAGILGLVVVNGVLATPNQFAPQQGSLSDYRSVVTYIGTLAESDTAIVHRSDRRAKMFNLFYSGNALQLVMPIDKLPAGVSHLALLSNAEDPALDGLEGWTPFEEQYRVGHTRVMIARRGRPPNS